MGVGGEEEVAGKRVKHHVRKDFLMVLRADGRGLAWLWECVIGSWVNPGQEGREGRGGPFGVGRSAT